MMASQIAMPRERHFEAVLHVFEFLCQNYNSGMAFDITDPAINMRELRECRWKDFYVEVK